MEEGKLSYWVDEKLKGTFDSLKVAVQKKLELYAVISLFFESSGSWTLYKHRRMTKNSNYLLTLEEIRKSIENSLKFQFHIDAARVYLNPKAPRNSGADSKLTRKKRKLVFLPAYFKKNRVFVQFYYY